MERDRQPAGQGPAEPGRKGLDRRADQKRGPLDRKPDPDAEPRHPAGDGPAGTARVIDRAAAAEPSGRA